jgi:hypothetical protein
MPPRARLQRRGLAPARDGDVAVVVRAKFGTDHGEGPPAPYPRTQVSAMGAAHVRDDLTQRAAP